MKYVISGYYGFNNSGDDALLMSIINGIRSTDDSAEITVLSKSPAETRKNYSVNAVNRYNIFSLIAKISCCDVLISGGGTLIQDATSTKSLVYYLSVIRIAKFFKKVGDDYVIIPEKEYLCISDVKTPSQREPTKELSVLISEKDFVIQKKGREKDSIYLLILSF